MIYKKIIRSRKIRAKILRTLNFIPDKTMLKIQYYIKHRRKLNLNKPKRFTEKIQYYKLNYRDKNMPICVDKFSVHNYVKSKGLENILNPVYAVYEKVEDINFSKLPDQFVLKSTNGGGGLNVIICENKNEMDLSVIEENLKSWLIPKKTSGGREWVYLDIKPRIIAERYLENDKNPAAGIIDYKFFCFNGVPEYIVVDIDRYIDHKRNFYDSKWNFLDITSDCPNFGDTMKKPEGLEAMLKVASTLSKDFPFVRVDLYYIDKEVIFGEMTFFPWSGYVNFTPDQFDFILGDKFHI